jgi:uncharacterized lipoprotein NlpE involved in copper resistance
MKTAQIISISAMLCLVGCATKQEYFTPPSAVEVQRNVSRVREYVKPEGRVAYAELEKSLNDYQAKVESQTKELIKAQDSAEYYHNKQIKALKELWIWRSIAIASILCVVAYIGIKTGWRLAI